MLGGVFQFGFRNLSKMKFFILILFSLPFFGLTQYIKTCFKVDAAEFSISSTSFELSLEGLPEFDTTKIIVRKETSKETAIELNDVFCSTGLANGNIRDGEIAYNCYVSFKHRKRIVASLTFSSLSRNFKFRCKNGSFYAGMTLIQEKMIIRVLKEYDLFELIDDSVRFP